MDGRTWVLCPAMERRSRATSTRPCASPGSWDPMWSSAIPRVVSMRACSPSSGPATWSPAPVAWCRMPITGPRRRLKPAVSARFGPGAGSLAGAIDRAKACAGAAARHALPSLDLQLIRCGPLPGASAEARRSALSVANWRTQESEAETLWGATSDEIDEDGVSLGDRPLVVLTAARNSTGASGACGPSFTANWPQTRPGGAPRWSKTADT